MKYIEILRAEIIGTNNKEQKDNKDKTDIGQARDAIATLRDYEKKINDYIEILSQKELEDNKLFQSKLDDQKNQIKFDKQKQQTIKKAEEAALKRMKAEKRAERVIITGRKVPWVYPVNKGKNKKVKKATNDDELDLEMLYYED